MSTMAYANTGRARHSVRAVSYFVNSGGQRTARPTAKRNFQT
jgi:hypothetical protein